jgi:histidinol-phosphate aminotransferase
VKLRKNIAEIPEYVPGRGVEEVKKAYGLERVVKLASNENPYGCSPKVYEVLQKVISTKTLNTYPPSNPEDLLEMISDYTGFEVSRIAVGAGIDGVLENIFRLLIEPGDEVVIPIPSFPYYHTLAAVSGAREVRVKRREDFRIDPSLVENLTRKTKLVIICSPNNPTGNDEDVDSITEIIQKAAEVGAAVFIDEAYAEFSNQNLMSLAEYENVIVARTFSKAFGLANLRVGYAVMAEWLKKEYMKVSTPFPLSSFAIEGAKAALLDVEYMKWAVKQIVKEREKLYSSLNEIGSVKAYPSSANFIYFETAILASLVAEKLARKGVIVRDCSGFIGCSDRAIRVSVGRREENELFVDALRETLEELDTPNNPEDQEDKGCVS